MLKDDLMHGKVAGFPTTHWTCCVFGYEMKSPQQWEKTENFDIPGEMTTEFIHDVMYVPLHTRRCLVHFCTHNLFDRNISKKKESDVLLQAQSGIRTWGPGPNQCMDLFKLL